MGRLGGVSLLLFFISFPVFADDAPPRPTSERVAIEHRFLPFSRFEDPPKGTPLGDARIQPEDTRVRFGFPPIRFPKHHAMLAPAISYEQIKFNYHNWGSGYEPNRVDELQSIGVSALYRQPLRSPLWAFGGLISGALASDFKDVAWSSVRVQGAAFVSRKVTGGNVSFGLALLNNYGRPRVFPAIGFDPDPAARHKFTLRLPVEASYFYCPPTNWEMGVAARISGMNAEITKAGAFHGKNVGYSIGTVGPSVRWKFTKSLTLSAEGGWVPYHRFQILDKSEKIRDYDLSTPYFVSTSLKLSL